MDTLDSAFKGKENNLTFIRLIAALAVIYGHTPAIVAGTSADWVSRTTGYAFLGGVAVDLFFIISGFLVTASILKNGLRSYLISRILRIFPALWVNLIVVTFLVGGLLTSLTASEYFTSSEVWNYFTGLAGAFRGAYFLPGVFSDHHSKAVNGSIWSVLIEVWMYIGLALVYVCGLMRSRAIFNCFFFILITATWSNNSWVPGFMSNATNLHVCLLFCIGSFLYINKKQIPTSPYYLLISLFLAAITLGTDKFSYGYVLVIVSFFCAACFYSQFSFMNKWGDYSYGVYLYGWPSQQLVVHLFPHWSGFQNFLAASTLALICGVLSWHYIEKKAMRLKRHFTPKSNYVSTAPSTNTGV